jgi:hypothetical protein
MRLFPAAVAGSSLASRTRTSEVIQTLSLAKILCISLSASSCAASQYAATVAKLPTRRNSLASVLSILSSLE